MITSKSRILNTKDKILINKRGVLFMANYEVPGIPGLNITIPENIENAKLPNPNLLMHFSNVGNRVFWIENEIDETIMLLAKYIISINKEDTGLSVAERQPIKIFLNSPGGCVEETLAFISLIKMSKTPVWTINMCTAYSGAALILMSGHKRFALPHTHCLIHSGSGGTGGTYEQTAKQMEHYDKIIEIMRNLILNSTTISAKTLNKNFSKEWYMTADEALKYGIIDEIVNDINILL